MFKLAKRFIASTWFWCPASLQQSISKDGLLAGGDWSTDYPAVLWTLHAKHWRLVSVTDRDIFEIESIFKYVTNLCCLFLLCNTDPPLHHPHPPLHSHYFNAQIYSFQSVQSIRPSLKLRSLSLRMNPGSMQIIS